MTHGRGALRADAVARCLTLVTPWAGVIYRSASPRYANSRDLLTGVGSQKTGGRWNPLGSFPTVYGSLDHETAWAESLEHYRVFQIPIASAMPKVMASIRVSLQGILDLTDPLVRRRLGVGLARLRKDPWRDSNRLGSESLTQSIGRLSFEAGLEALVVPSGPRRAGKNLVVFVKNLASESRLEPFNPDDLPQPFL